MGTNRSVKYQHTLNKKGALSRSDCFDGLSMHWKFGKHSCLLRTHEERQVSTLKMRLIFNRCTLLLKHYCVWFPSKHLWWVSLLRERERIERESERIEHEIQGFSISTLHSLTSHTFLFSNQRQYSKLQTLSICRSCIHLFIIFCPLKSKGQLKLDKIG